MKKVNYDTRFMKLAIKEAKKGFEDGDAPFGAVVVKDNKILSKAHAVVDTQNDPTGHGEIQAIRKATKKLKGHHLEDSTLYTTCEPCMMCTSAIFYSKIPRVVVGATRKDSPKFFDQKKYAFSTLKNQARYKIQTRFGILKEECRQLYVDKNN